MLAKRLIVCMDVKDGRVVKGTNFVGLRDAGDPVECAVRYDAEEADELVFLDITAGHEKRQTTVDLVRRCAQELSIPFTIGGGVRSVADFETLLRAGADKVATRLCELADTGILLDCAHLAIYQNAMGYEPLAGFDALDWSRVIEMHVAGSTQSHVGDYWFIEDDHSTNVLPDTWTVFENACLRTSQLRAVVFECERNLISKTLPHFQHILTTMEQIRTGLPSIDAMERAHVP